MADDRTQRQRMLDGDLYIADDPELAADSLRARRLQDRFNATVADADEERRRILEELLGGFGAESESARRSPATTATRSASAPGCSPTSA